MPIIWKSVIDDVTLCEAVEFGPQLMSIVVQDYLVVKYVVTVGISLLFLWISCFIAVPAHIKNKKRAFPVNMNL